MKTSLYNNYKVNLIESIDELQNLKSLFDVKIMVGIDTETTGLSYISDEIVGVCVSGGKSYSVNDYQGYYLPVRHLSYSKNLPIKDVIEFVQYLSDNYKTVYFNRPFDFTMLEKDGFICPYTGKSHDAQIMAHLATNESFPSLKGYVKKYLNFDVIEFSQNKADKGNFGSTDPEISHIYACFSEDTKFMTKSGWKLFDQIEDSEEIAQYNPETGGLEFVKPLKRFDYIASELMEARSKSVSMKVTPNHRVWGRSNIRRDWRVAQASNWYGKSFQLQTQTKGYDCEPIGDFTFESSITYGVESHASIVERDNTFTIKALDMFKLFGFILGNGNVCKNNTSWQVKFSQKNIKAKEHHIQWLRDLNKSLGNLFYETLNKKNNYVWSKAHKSFGAWMRSNMYREDRSKYIPDWVFRGSLEQRKAFIEGLRVADGSLHKDRKGYNIDVRKNKELAEQVLYLVNSVGYSCEMSVNLDKDTTFSKEPYFCYRILINPHLEAKSVNKDSWTKDYNKRVVCFSVPSSFLLVQRDYITYVSGNCQDPLVTVLLARKLWSEFPYIRKIYPLDNKVGEAMRYLSTNSKLYLDHDFLSKELFKINRQLQDIQNKIFAFVGYTFNLNSTADKSDALNRYVTLTKKTSKGKFAVDKEALANIDHPLAKMFLEYSAVETLRHSFVEKLNQFPDTIKINYSTVNVSCLTENNYIQTHDDFKSIRDIEVGDLVQTRFGFKKVLYVNSYQDEIYTINLSNGTFIEGNYKHPILTPDGWKIMKDIVKGDEVVCFDTHEYTVTVSNIIHSTKLQTVYDIEVDEVHEFVANGVVTHNTGRLSSGSSKGNDYYANLNIQNIPKIEVFRYVHRDPEIGYSLNDKPYNPIPDSLNLQSKNITEIEGYESDGNQECYEVELESGEKQIIPHHALVKVLRDNSEQIIYIEQLKETDELLNIS